MEHKWHSNPKTLAVPHQPTATEATQASAAARTESMAETSPKTLKAILEAVRERIDYRIGRARERIDSPFISPTFLHSCTQ
jgi:hypothetical protein